LLGVIDFNLLSLPCSFSSASAKGESNRHRIPILFRELTPLALAGIRRRHTAISRNAGEIQNEFFVIYLIKLAL